jgi:hypothetical protein
MPVSNSFNWSQRQSYTPVGVPAISRGLSPAEADNTPGHECY